MSKTTAESPDTNKQADVEQFKLMKMQWGDPAFVKAHIKACMDTNEVAGVIGKAGIGKTDIVQQLVKELSESTGKTWGCRVIQLQHLEKEDIAGFPFPDPDNSHSVVMRLLKRLPREGDCEECGIIFFDEFNRADKSVTNAVFPVMEERRIGDWYVPKGWHVVLAGNVSDDAYAVNEAEKDPAIRRRVCWVGAVCNSRQWLEYARSVGMHQSVIEFIAANPPALYDDTAHRNGAIGASPASWEKVSKSMHAAGKNGKAVLSKIAGNIGLPRALDFVKFAEEISNKPPPPLEILLNFTTDENLQRRVKMLEPGETANLSSSVLHALNELSADADQKVVETNLAEYLNTLTSDGFANFIELVVQSVATNMSPIAASVLESMSQDKKYKARAKKVQKSIASLNGKSVVLTDGDKTVTV
jgi:hypothetical protein